jgi:excisionase family DNA binding protein
MPSDRLLTVPEAMDRLQVSRVTLYQFIGSGALPSVLLGKRLRRIRQRDLDRFIAAHLDVRVPAGATGGEAA